MEFFDKITKYIDKFSGNGPEADLDNVTTKTQEELKKLKEGQGTANSVLEEGLKGLRKDLDELDIKDEAKRKEYEGQYVEAFQREMTDQKMEAINSSPEFSGLDDFVEKYASYTKLDAMIAKAKETGSTDPFTNFFNSMKAGMKPSTITLLGMLAGMFSKPEPGKEPGFFQQKLAEVAAIFSGDKKKKKPEEEAKPTAAVAATTPEKTEAPEKYAAEIKKLEDAGLPIDKANFEKDAEGLGAEDMTKLIESASKEKSNSKLVAESVKTKLGNNFSEFKFSILDIKTLESLKDSDQVMKVAKALTEKETVTVAEANQTLKDARDVNNKIYS